jgi:hypothetical protein
MTVLFCLSSSGCNLLGRRELEEQDRENSTSRKGLEEQDRQKITGRTGQAEQDRQDRTGRIGQDRTSRTRLPEQDVTDIIFSYNY